MAAEPAAPSLAASASPSSEPAFTACPVCGGPVARGNGHTPWLETPEGRKARQETRAKALALANQIPTRWHRLRDERGRFLSRSRP